MKSLIQNFTTTQTNQNILETPQVLNAIKLTFGEDSSTYMDVIKHKPTEMDIAAIICNNPTQIEIRNNYDTPSYPQNLIEDTVFTYAENNNIAQVISTQIISGTIYLVVK